MIKIAINDKDETIKSIIYGGIFCLTLTFLPYILMFQLGEKIERTKIIQEVIKIKQEILKVSIPRHKHKYSTGEAVYE